MKKIKCPTCGKDTEYCEQNRFRPFCSHRCKLIDLGEWAEENYRVPDANAPTTEISEDEELPSEDESSKPLLH